MPSPAVKSFLEQMIERHDTEDLLAIMKNELQSKNYQTALNIHKEMDASLAQSPRAQLYRLRAIKGAKNPKALKKYFDATQVHDGEYFLAKARLRYSENRFDESLSLIEKALSAPKLLLSSDELRREALYWRARGVTAQFNGNPTEALYKSALDAWWPFTCKRKRTTLTFSRPRPSDNASPKHITPAEANQ